jgi:cell wall-associated NlpC family hydrolase
VLSLCVLASAGDALARGPVFAVVSGAQAGHESLTQAIRRQLSTDKRTLSAVSRLQRRDGALLQRAGSEAIRAADPFPAEDRMGRLRQRIAAENTQASRIRSAIRGLEASLRPSAPPTDLLSSPSTTIGSYAVSIAERYLDVRYVWGGSSPSSGFDCSGFVKFVYAQLGVQLPHYAAAQFASTVHIDPSQLQPGDLVFFEPRADGPGHVGMYVGNDVFIEAPHAGDVVKFANLSTEAQLMGFVGATRPSV